MQPTEGTPARDSRASPLPLSPTSLPQVSPHDGKPTPDGIESIGPTNPPKSDKTKEMSAIEWWRTFIKHRKDIFPSNSFPNSILPVRIAIVDTGIDTTNHFILQNWRNKMNAPAERYRDFLSDDTSVIQVAEDPRGYSSNEVLRFLDNLGAGSNAEPFDVSGHGTHLAGIVLQLVPDALLFVARVLENEPRRERCEDVRAVARRVALVCTP
jgi:hypothetical protein